MIPLPSFPHIERLIFCSFNLTICLAPICELLKEGGVLFSYFVDSLLAILGIWYPKCIESPLLLLCVSVPQMYGDPLCTEPNTFIPHMIVLVGTLGSASSRGTSFSCWMRMRYTPF